MIKTVRETLLGLFVIAAAGVVVILAKLAVDWLADHESVVSAVVAVVILTVCGGILLDVAHSIGKGVIALWRDE